MVRAVSAARGRERLGFGCKNRRDRASVRTVDAEATVAQRVSRHRLALA